MKKRMGLTTAGVVVVALLAAGAGVLFIPDAPSPAPTTSTSSSSTTRPSTSTVPSSPSSPSTPAPKPTTDPPASVGTFQMDGPAAVAGATYDSMPYVLPLNPAGPQDSMVRWVDGLGVDPTRSEDGTVYVLGHAWGQQRLVFNPISEIVTGAVDTANPGYIDGTDGMPVSRLESDVLNGSWITMSDTQGNQRTWVVSRSWLVGKNDAIADPDVMAQDRKGRIVLIACSVSGQQDLGYNVVVEGFLER